MAEIVEWCTVVWQVVDGTTSAASPIWNTYGVPALTGGIGVLGILIGQRNQARSQAKSVRAAVLAEISAITKQLVSQEIKPHLRAAAVEIRTNTDPKLVVRPRVRVVSHGDVNKIYKANLAHLGGLSKDEAVLVVRFHCLLESILAAVLDGGPLAEGRSDPSMYESVADILEKVEEIGNELTCQNKTRWWHSLRGQNVDTEAKGNAG